MSAAQCEKYHLGTPQEAYYLAGIKEEGRWVGSGVERLGLEPTVKREAFHNLLLGFSPDGKTPLVQNAGDPDRQCAWDLTFSAPKSVAVLWALSPAHVRREIEQAHGDAVEKTLVYAEKIAGITRRGKGGVIKEQAALIFATFQEGTSRADDPNPHFHCVLINAGLRQDGTTGALQSRDMFRAKMILGAHYQQELAQNLCHRLGLTIKPEKVAFHVQGVPKGLCRIFSTRRRMVEKVMRERGLSGAVAAKNVTLETRPEKQHIPAGELFPRWREVAQAYGWGPEQAQRLLERAEPQAMQEKSAENQRPTQQPEPAPHPLPPGEKQATSAPSATNKDQERRSPTPKTSAKQPEPSPERVAESQHRSEARPQPDPSESSENHRHTESQTRQKDRPTVSHENDARGTSNRTQSARSDQSRRRTDRARQERPREAHRTTKRTATERVLRFARAMREAREAIARNHTIAARWGRIRWQKNLGLVELRVQNRQIFRRAPEWSPFHGHALPALRLVPRVPKRIARLFEVRPAWGRVLWRRDLGPVELRLQKHRVFSRAPRWSPASKVQLPALRLVSKMPNMRQTARSHENGHSHSH